uniref:Uncharacterized protein n=1 Tax=Anguilla anguilla TaxID=7936 RepID=A0A0E9SX12_ANGAN
MKPLVRGCSKGTTQNRNIIPLNLESTVNVLSWWRGPFLLTFPVTFSSSHYKQMSVKKSSK